MSEYVTGRRVPMREAHLPCAGRFQCVGDRAGIRDDLPICQHE